jgi:hypothetical protein
MMLLVGSCCSPDGCLSEGFSQMADITLRAAKLCRRTRVRQSAAAAGLTTDDEVRSP